MLEITYPHSFLDLAFGKARATIRHPVVIICNLAILAVLGLCLLHDTDHNHSVVIGVFVIGVWKLLQGVNGNVAGREAGDFEMTGVVEQGGGQSHLFP